jgi:septum formation protein
MSAARSAERPALVLASASPRRRSLMERVGLQVDVLPVDVDESALPDENTEDTALRLAAEKARTAALRERERPILAADTIVCIDGRQLGKPADRPGAITMLRDLSGRWHEVVTGVALLSPDGTLHTALARTRVRFAELTPVEIERYADSDEPYDKAGGYAIQGAASWFVETIAGSSSNVVGLPLEQVRRLLSDAGLQLPASVPGGEKAGSTGHLAARGDDPI